MVLHVVVQIKVRIVHPLRVREVERHPRQALAKLGYQVQALLDVSTQPVELELTLQYQDTGGVQRTAGRLTVKEPGITFRKTHLPGPPMGALTA